MVNAPITTMSQSLIDGPCHQAAEYQQQIKRNSRTAFKGCQRRDHHFRSGSPESNDYHAD